RAPRVDDRRGARARAPAGGLRCPASQKARPGGRTGCRLGELKIVYSPRYRIDIGAHVFPTLKYSLIHARLLETGVIQPSDCIEPDPASWSDLALVHSDEYLSKMRDGTLSEEDVDQLELPWSPEMVDGFRLMTGGTIQAAKIAC